MAKKAKSDGGIYSGFKRASELMAEQKESSVCVPVGPKLDDALGGGVPSGTFVVIRTKQKSGKTTLCMNIARNALLQGRRVFFYDVENRVLAKKYLSLENFDPNDPNFFYRSSQSGELLSAEAILTEQIQLMLMEENRGAVYIIDSFSKLVSQEVLEDKNVSGKRRSDIAKTQTDWLAKAGNLIRVSDSIVIGIQHLMVEQGGSSYMGPSLKPKGADGINYEADISLESRSNPADLDGNTQFSEKELSGVSMKLKIPYNKRKSPVNTKDGIVTYLKFGEGVYFAKEMFELLQELFVTSLDEDGKPVLTEMLSRAGAWYQFNCGEITDRVQGSEKAIEVIENNKSYFQELHRKNMIEMYDAKYDFK